MFHRINIDSSFSDLPINWQNNYIWSVKVRPRQVKPYFDSDKIGLMLSGGHFLFTNAESIFNIKGEKFDLYWREIQIDEFFKKIWQNENRLPLEVRTLVTHQTAQMVFWFLENNSPCPPSSISLHFNKNNCYGPPTSYEIDTKGKIFIITNAVLNSGTKKTRVAIEYDKEKKFSERNLELKVFYSTDLCKPVAPSLDCSAEVFNKYKETCRQIDYLMHKRNKEIKTHACIGTKSFVVKKDHDTVYSTNSGKLRGGLLVEYCDKGKLSSFIHYPFFRTDENLYKIISDILNALIHLKLSKILHHNINPENIFINTSRIKIVAKITGFGLSQSSDNNDTLELGGSYEFMYPNKLKALMELQQLYSMSQTLFPSDQSLTTSSDIPYLVPTLEYSKTTFNISRGAFFEEDSEKIKSLENNLFSEFEDVWAMGMVLFSIFMKNKTIWNAFECFSDEEKIQKLVSISQPIIDFQFPPIIQPNSIWVLIKRMLTLDNMPTAEECLQIFLELRSKGMILM